MSGEALRQCSEHDLDPRAVYKWQYAVVAASAPGTVFDRRVLGEWAVDSGPGLPVAGVRDTAGHEIGIFLGIGAHGGTLIEDGYVIEGAKAGDGAFFDTVEAWLKHVAGRYTLLVFANGSTRLYTDPVGMNGLVYDRDTRKAASTPLMCLDRRVQDHPRYDHALVESGLGKYSLFHTRDAHVLRCNPNFYLDLSDFSEHRFWPRDEDFVPDVPLGALYDEIAQTTKATIRAINARFETALPLSGGFDSRLLAAMAGEEIRGFDQFFTQVYNFASKRDAAIAAEIARQLQIPHASFDSDEMTISEAELAKEQTVFELASGVRTPVNREVVAGLHRGLAPDAVVMRGHQTDLLRAVFTFRLGPRARKNLRWQIKRLFIVPPKDYSQAIYDEFLPDYTAWLDTLPEGARRCSVDFMFLEIYYSSTLGVTFPALTRNFFLSPFNSRRMIELSLSIDEVYRRGGHAVQDMLLRLNPALLRLPFDSEIKAVGGLKAIGDTERVDRVTAPRVAETLTRAQSL